MTHKGLTDYFIIIFIFCLTDVLDRSGAVFVGTITLKSTEPSADCVYIVFWRTVPFYFPS